MTWYKHNSRATVVLLFLFCVTPQLATASPLTEQRLSDDLGDTPPPSEIPQLDGAENAKVPEVTQAETGLTEMSPEDEDELFKDVDPKTLAAVLLQALNRPGDEKKSSRLEERAEGKENEKGEEEAPQGGGRDRDGRQELELVMAAAAAENKEAQEKEKERKREEEERLTEKVKSRTTSQTMPVKDQSEQEVLKEPETKEEEQLSSQEMKKLQTMLEELHHFSTTTKREWDSVGQRESRGSYTNTDKDFLNNDIDIKPKGYKLAMSKKKIKWQEEQQKQKQPFYKGGNFMDDFDIQTNSQEEGDKEQEEELLSPEEEEARAKAEQEEVRRQAAEAQRAKAEEEKLADIASDMLLQYMVKPDVKQNQDQAKKAFLGNNVAEDKRSDEEDNSNDEDDIDPQTIDKLIEISSKLHLPADDVVDIISDVERKKKKDAPENLPWYRPLAPPPVPAPAPSPLNPAPKQPTQLNRPSKPWLQEKFPVKQIKQDFGPKPQKQIWTYPSNKFYQKPLRGYYPIYFPPPKPKPRYYVKPAFSFNNVLGGSMDYGFDFSPKQKLRSWAQPALRRNFYLPKYVFPNPRTFKQVPMPKPRSPPRRRPPFYDPPATPMILRDEDYYSPVGQLAKSDQNLENFIQKVFLKRPRLFQ
ncbi:uncharacterized protein vgf [Paramormyrops kingsleyae]|uniref:uncharacterized protein vgf n=1 Tax=Paramormyrops kingsleyae TaxID=1676925 RepID=UPI000CD5DB5F|nr:neurosecretory protein VGF-like [Paramormyrops kingsleyae]XP_023688190.1 neurosecretory protein VGF-like [Paramormyrops kingsleyae]